MKENTKHKRHVSLLVPYRKDKGELFFYLQKRTEDAPRYPGFYAFFGGGIEPHETHEQALKREIYEELSYVPPHMHFFKEYVFEHVVESVFFVETAEDFESKVRVREGEYGLFVKISDISKQQLKISENDRTVLRDLSVFFDTLTSN